VRRQTAQLVADLSEEDCLVQSMPDASPTKWHLAHTTWFFETFVLPQADAHYTTYDADFGYLFNSYYETVGRMHPRPQRGLLTRPSLTTIMAYRDHVDEKLGALLADNDGHDLGALRDVLELGLHHEQQHQELILTDIKHAFSCNPTLPAYDSSPRTTNKVGAAPARWISRPASVSEIGHIENGFAFDNEAPRHRQVVEAHEIQTRPVTLGEYRAFIDDGGYTRPELWLSNGWALVNERGWRAPLYWIERDGQWGQFSLAGLRVPAEAEPITHLSYYEADAYARWAGARLPTEAEWELVARDCALEGNFAESRRYHPTRTEIHGSGPAALFGDVWEWTSSPYMPYPGYAAPTGALGEYNGKFMSGQMVLRGGSCATPQSHIRTSYRNFFPPDARWQFSGLRLARNTTA
jgi:ergothioneine biosynthesis protein EgtB